MKCSFEKDLDELEEIVSHLENDDLDLEDAFEKFKKGMELTKKCDKSLNEMEKKIKVLIEEDGNLVEEDFDEE